MAVYDVTTPWLQLIAVEQMLVQPPQRHFGPCFQFSIKRGTIEASVFKI